MTTEPRRVARLALAAIVVLASVVPVAVASASAQREATRPADAQIDPDTVLIRIDVEADAAARWTVEYRVRLDDENTTEAFESIREEIRTDPEQYLERFETRMRETVASASNETGRDMALRNATVSAAREQIPQEYGVIRYTFEWVGFAKREDGSLVVGDAIGGLYLDSETTLLVGWPADHRLDAASPEPTERRERSVVWSGPVAFGSAEPTIVLSPAATSPTATGTTSGPGNGGIPSSTATLVVAVLLGIVGLAVVLGAAHRFRGGRRAAPDGRSSPEPDDEMLSNEERVLALLEAEGGRMKQQRVVEELGWSDAKTSKVVRGMRDEGEIDVYRIGRENVLALPETDI